MFNRPGTPHQKPAEKCPTRGIAVVVSSTWRQRVTPGCSWWSQGILPYLTIYGYGSIPINTIFSGMNIHLPAILMFTRGTRFWHTAIYVYVCIGNDNYPWNQAVFHGMTLRFFLTLLTWRHWFYSLGLGKEFWVPTGKDDHHGHERLSQRFQLEESLRQQICPGTHGNPSRWRFRMKSTGFVLLVLDYKGHELGAQSPYLQYKERHLNWLNGTCTGKRCLSSNRSVV